MIPAGPTARVRCRRRRAILAAARLAAAAVLATSALTARAQDVGGAPPQEAAPVAVARQPGTALLYFFSPDWRPPDLGKLTASVESAFAAGGVPV
jgi:hypothetical protein